MRRERWRRDIYGLCANSRVGWLDIEAIDGVFTAPLSVISVSRNPRVRHVPLNKTVQRSSAPWSTVQLLQTPVTVRASIATVLETSCQVSVEAIADSFSDQWIGRLPPSA